MFTWATTNMDNIDPKVITHKLSICKKERVVSRKKRKLGKKEG